MGVDWDQATYEAIQEDGPQRAAILSDEVLERLQVLENENFILRESMDEVSMMFRAEDRGWVAISGVSTAEHVEGLTLSEIKDISKTIRPHLIGGSLVKRGADLHIGYVWGKGLNIEGAERKKGKPGVSSDLQKVFANPVNQENVFSSTAREELQKARYSDGNIYLACNTSTKEIRRIPLEQITDIKVNPEFPEEIWAYQRTWNPNTGPNAREIKRWYYTSRFNGRKQQTYTKDGETVSVDTEIVVVDLRVNRQVGYPLGVPDAVAAMVWIAAYEEIIQYGRVVNQSLAKILYKVISKTKNGANNAAVKIAGMTGFGNTASMVEGQDIAAFQHAGKGYDFATARPVAAMAAASLNVSNVEFLSDSSAAGSSYGAAQTLSPSTKNAMRAMQSVWVEMYQEVFRVLGLKETPRIWFEPLEDVDPYRAAQQLTILAMTLSDEEYRGKALDILDIAGDPNDVPDILKTRTQAAQTAASPDQGQSNGTGGDDSTNKNDQRDDSIGEALKRMQDENYLDRLDNLVQRLEGLNIPPL